MSSKAEKLIFKLFENVKRYQNNIDETLAITLILVYLIHNKEEKFILKAKLEEPELENSYDKSFEYLFETFYNDLSLNFTNDHLFEYLIGNIEEYSDIAIFSKNIIKNAIEKLFDEKCQFLSPSARPTNKFTQKLITKIAKTLNAKGPYIDLAVGTGGLLKDFDGEVWGDDINPKMVAIARCYLYFYFGNIEFKGITNDIRLNDSIETYEYSKYRDAVIIFDPPMGDLRTYPKDKEWQNTDIIGQKKPNRLQSEILFLMNVLLNADENDHFIGLFPENILTKNNKEYNNLRKYLIQHSLICIIKVPTGHVLLVGKNGKNIEDEYPYIPVLNISMELNEEQLNFIAEELKRKNDYSFEEFYKIHPDGMGTIVKDIGIIAYNKDWAQIFNYVIYNRKELLNNRSIVIPSIHKSEEKQNLDPQYWYKKIVDNEEKIKNKIENIREIIINFSDNYDGENTDLELWFDKIDIPETPEIKGLRYFNKKHFLLTEEKINTPQTFQIRQNINKESFEHIKDLYFSGRISFTNNNILKIYYKENDNKQNTTPEIFFKYFNPRTLDKNIEALLKMTDSIVQDIYENHCQYCINNLEESETFLINKKYSNKDIVRSLKVLETLGLVQKTPLSDEEKKSEMALYDEYKTYFPESIKGEN